MAERWHLPPTRYGTRLTVKGVETITYSDGSLRRITWVDNGIRVQAEQRGSVGVATVTVTLGEDQLTLGSDYPALPVDPLMTPELREYFLGIFDALREAWKGVLAGEEAARQAAKDQAEQERVERISTVATMLTRRAKPRHRHPRS